MSLILTTVVVAAALCASAGGGYLAALRRSKAKSEGKDDEQNRNEKEDDRTKKDSAKKDGNKKERSPAAKKRDQKEEERSLFEGLPLCLGDVVVAEGEERWLAGGVIAREGDRVVAAVFFAPEGARTKAVVAFARPRNDILWLSPTSVDSPSEPPASCEINGVAMTRRGRLPVVLSRRGQGVPVMGEAGVLAEYEGGADEVAVLLTSEGRAHAWSGRRLVEGDYDRLGSGGDDDT